MSINERFDELARRKLEERAFPFEEGAWLEAQKTLGQHQRRRFGWWYIAGAAAIAVAVGLLWPQSEGTQVADVRSTTVGNTGGSNAIPTVTEAPAGILEHSTGSNKEDTNIAEQTPQPNTLPAVPTMVEDVTAAKNERRSTGTPEARPQARKGHASGSSTSRSHEDPVAETTPAPQAIPTPSFPITPAERITTAPVSGIDPLLGAGAASTAAPNEPATGTSGIEPTVHTTTTKVGAEGNDPQNNAPVLDGITDGGYEAPVARTTDTTTTTALDPVSLSEPLGSTTPPNDSASSTPPVVPIAPPLVTPLSPWEVSVLAGLLNTTSTYSGGDAGKWTVSPERTTAIGAEVMHMGRNFGVGSGIHYGTYADRLATPEERITSTQYDRYWYLTTIDTTVLIITGTDTTTGIHTGLSVPTSVQVLRSAYDTVVTSTLLREARERINRTSYLEVPVLLDGHLVQGRWSLGVRGGPVVSMLTSSRGSIPNSGAEGELDFKDATVRTWMLGWTARAYVRYRFNSAWSVGIEPMARGQLLDAIDHDGTTRRSAGLGCMISLSYRLP